MMTVDTFAGFKAAWKLPIVSPCSSSPCWSAC